MNFGGIVSSVVGPLKCLLWVILIGCFFRATAAEAAVNLTYYTNPSISINSTAAWGQYVNLNYSVINTGSTASGAFQVRFYLSSTSTINTATNYLWYVQNLPSLSTNQYVSGPILINLPQTIPSGLANGTVYVGMAIFLNGSVVESNVGLNKDLTTVITTAPLTLPDLIGFDGRPYGNSYFFGVQQSSATWGQTIGIQHAIFNQTVVNAGAFTGNIYISKTNHFAVNDPNCYIIGSFSESSLPGGAVAYSPGYVNYRLPQTNPFGDSTTTFYVGIIINPDQALNEGNYSNNSNQGGGIDMGSSPITITPAIPQMSASWSSAPGAPSGTDIYFGSVGVDGAGGALATQTVTITNNGAAPLNITGISTFGAPFTITNISSTITSLPKPNTYPATIQGNGVESWVITVTYDPTAVGSTEQTGSLAIYSNDPTHPTRSLALGGFGIGVPHVTLADSIPPTNDLISDYGSVINDGTGGTSFSLGFNLANSGSGPLTVNQNGISLTNTQGGVWAVTSITSNTQSGVSLSSLSSGSKTIAANNTEVWSVVVKFDPIANTNFLTALQVQSNDPVQSVLNCTLKGTGVIPMTLSVTDSLGSPSSMNFGSAHATGHQRITGTLTLTNTGGLPLVIAQNGLAITNATNFQITSIQSSTQGAINLATGSNTIGINGSETWVVTVVFDPVATGGLSTQLTILSNDPSHGTNPITLNGTGLNQPGISLTNSSNTPTGLNIPYGPVLNDGSGGRTATQTITIQNIGLQSLSIPINGISLSNATAFAIQSIVSSTQGNITLSSSSASIAPNQAETWTVTVAFDPTSNTAYTGNLIVQSNDPINSSIAEKLSGSGTTPSITLQPQSAGLPTLYIPAGQIYNIKWSATYPAGSAQITLSRDTDTNPASGLVQIGSVPYVAAPDETSGALTWRPDASLVGQEFYLYGAIQDGSIVNGSYGTQKIHIEAAGSFNLLSGLQTTSTNYVYEYIYKGTVYGGSATLQPGQNTISITTPLSGGGNVVHQITVTQVSSLLAIQGYTYDELNRIKTYTNGNGITTSYSYDPAGNLVQTSATNGNVVSYVYDNIRRKTSVTESTGTTFYDYDDLDRVTAITYSKDSVKGNADDLVLAYQYDNANRLTDITYPGGEHIQYVWDDAGRMLQANDVTSGQNSTYAYDYTTGQLQSLTRANGVVTTYGYNNIGQVNDIRHKRGSAILSDYSYTLNATGNALSLLTTFPDGSQKQEKYRYDGLNRLTEVIYGSTATAGVNDKTISYTYDGVGNRLTQTTKVNNAVTQTLAYAYSSENRLTSVIDQNSNSIANYFYDAAGNRIQKVTPTGSMYYTYDERNLLTSVLTPTDYTTYAYNYLGQRVSQTVNGTTTDFIASPGQSSFQIVQERTNGSIAINHVFGTDKLESNPVSASPRFPLPDRIESVRLITDSSGNVVTSSSYDAFGLRVAP